MKAALLREFGQRLVIENVADPVAADDELLIRVEACGVCHSDLHIVAHEWTETAAGMDLPCILGHEVVGTVVEQGSAVRAPRVGERVGLGWLCWTCGECEPCVSGHENLCLKRQVTGLARPGGYAEYLCVRASHAMPVPRDLEPFEAAPLFCAGLTMYHACQSAALEPEQEVAVFGTGGLGHLAVQFAKQLGSHVIAIDVNDDKLRLAREVGADEVINITDPDASTLLAERGGVHVALVTAPSKKAYDIALRSLRLRGTLVVVGIPKEELTFLADDVITTEQRIVGAAVGTRDEMHDVLQLAAQKRVRCRVERHAFDDINDVLEKMREGTIVGRAVLTFE